MGPFKASRQRITSGVEELDRLLDGLFIGDNVVWYDHAGSLASVFCMNLLSSSKALAKPMVYVSFDRSPRNLLEKLGSLAEYGRLTILDCFTYGKGAGSEVFASFYREGMGDWPCRLVKVDEPRKMGQVVDALYEVHSSMEGDVRYIFESLTGMQELWGSEDILASFYAHSCPRLYELNTIAYWIMEKDAHSQRLRAQINQIAQVVIDLSIKRGRTSLAIVKAERRKLENLDKPYDYWTKELEVNIGAEEERRVSGSPELGRRIKEARTTRGVSQSELARLIGVTPSTISQIESNLIYPSLPALLKIAEVLSIEASSFFQDRGGDKKKCVFPAFESHEVKLADRADKGVIAKALMTADLASSAEPFLVEIAPRRKLSSHFFMHKGEELGYLISGKLEVTIDNVVHRIRAGDALFLSSEIPSQWKNPGPGAAKLLWIKLK
jgi:transcriptional regulator with XRE-family HTH domain